MGTGRLLEWLSVRVVSLGVARVAHTGIDVPYGLRALFRAEGAEGDELTRHLLTTARRPAHLDVVELTVALTAGTPEACVSVLSALGQDAPLVLIIPGAQRPHAVLDVVERLLDADGQVLVVMGLRDDEAFGHPEVDARCRAATALPRWTTHRVPPMDPASLRRILRTLVPLEPALLERLVARARGNPGYAVSLVRAWRTSLTEGPEGLRVPEHVELRPPPGLDRWLGLLSDVDPELRASLEVLAVLSVATPGVWAAATRQAGVGWDEAFPTRARAHALVERRGEELQLASPALADALLSDLDTAGRRAIVHDAAASAIADAHTPEDLAARGRHLFAAGRPDEAIAPLFEASMADTGHAFGEGWLHDLERALQAACAPDSDPRWLDTLSALLEHHRVRWQDRAVRERLPRYAHLAASDPAHHWRARMLAALLDDADPRPVLEAIWPELPTGAAWRRVAQEGAWAALERGDLDDVAAWLARVDDDTDPLLLELRSELERRRGRGARALELAEQAAARVPDRHPLASSIWSQLGDLRRDAGRLDEAERAYQRSLALALARDDDRQAAVVELNLLLLRLQAEQAVPRSQIATVRRSLRGGSRDADLAAALLELLLLPDDELADAVEALVPTLPRDHPELGAIARVVRGARTHRALDAVVAAFEE